MAKTQKISFEESLQALEKLVQEMESGELSLEQSLAAYERGMKLGDACQQALAEAELKVEQLSEKHGELLATALPGSE